MTLDPALTELDPERLAQRRSAKWTRFGPEVLPAWVAEMDFPLAPPVKAAVADALELDDLGYANPLLPGGLHEAFAGFAERRWGWELDPAGVVPLVDGVAGLTELLRVLTEPGDSVIVSPPVYGPFFSIVRDAGRELAEVPLAGGRELDLEAIERSFAAGARALLLCNPQNPTGAVLTADCQRAIGDLAAGYGAWVLADEIHAPLVLGDAVHVPFPTTGANAGMRGIVVTSASKAFNVAGLKSALAVSTGEPARAAVERLPEVARHPGHLGVIASVAAFAHGDAWLDSVRAVLEHNRDLLRELLAERLPEVGYAPPSAGYLAWLDFSALGLGDDPAEALRERGAVALSGGPWFGSGGEGRARLNFATSPALLERAVERIARAVGR